jgi:G:T-mismatch repair DNA endonuclease (very short patch repair protein)
MVRMITAKCEVCSSYFEQNISRRSGKIAAGRDLCSSCTSKENKMRFAIAGTKALKSISPELKRKYASDAGKKSGKLPNAGRFSSERWSLMAPEDRVVQVKRASAAHHKRMKNDPMYAAKVYGKILSQKQIGFQSNGHKSLHEKIKDLGFESHKMISSLETDECHEKLKIIIEYNGDFWHCNPRTWKSDQYNSVLKMTAEQKWRLDLSRKKVLEKFGFTIIVVWESEWIKDQEKVLNKIRNIYEARKQKINSSANVL